MIFRPGEILGYSDASASAAAFAFDGRVVLMRSYVITMQNIAPDRQPILPKKNTIIGRTSWVEVLGAIRSAINSPV